MKQISIYLHGLPLLLGFGLAFGGLPLYHSFGYGCHILPPPDGEIWASLVFVVLPIGISIVWITICMFIIYNKVRAQAAISRRWSISIGQASRLHPTVFWQCLFYVLAFYITWPILFGVYLASVDANGPLWLTLIVAFVAPLQGFNNFLVYVRPKLSSTTTTRSSSLS